MALDITITHGVFIGIVILALGGNLLVILAFVFNKLSLKKPHNVFIFTLAVTDFVTALFLIPSKYLYLPPVPKSEVLAPHFCRLIWGSYFLFGFAGVSVNTCFMLAVERWLAVVKPFTYKVMTYKHAIAMAIFSWIWAYLWDLAVILQVTYDENLHQCQWTFVEGISTPAATISFYVIKTFIPFSVIIALYTNLLLKLKKTAKLAGSSLDINRRRRITYMAFAASTALVIGWLPPHTNFLFAQFGFTNAENTFHHLLISLAFFNSCINPFLYAFINSDFRVAYKKVIIEVLICGNKGAGTQVDPDAEGQSQTSGAQYTGGTV